MVWSRVSGKVTPQPEWNLNDRHKHADNRLSDWDYSGNGTLASTACNLGPPADSPKPELSVYDEVKLRAHQLRRVADPHE
jgi:hypothetical protein